jgi:hypothetical protein
MKIKLLAAILVSSMLAVYITGCSKQSADRLTGGMTCDTTGISYAKQVFPILVDNCYTCHQGLNAPSGIDLSSFATLQTYVSNGNLVNAVNHTGTVPSMPLDLPMLPPCEISIITAWAHQGALNN